MLFLAGLTFSASHVELRSLAEAAPAPRHRLRVRARPKQSLPPPLRLAGSPAEAAALPAAAPTPEPIPVPSLSAAPSATPAEPAVAAAPRSEPATKPEAAEEAIISCRPDRESREPRVLCSDGKSWTLRSAGLILPPVLRCSSQLPECCQVGFRNMRDVQLADLLRVGEGQAPVCHMRVQDFLQHPPSRQAATTGDRLDDELPPGLRASGESGRPEVECKKGQYLAMGSCHDARKLLAALRPPPLVDPNRTLVPEADEVVERMRHDFDATGKCPQAALDIEVLQRIYNAAELRAELVADTPLDVTPLLARAQSPGGAQPEPHLPASCGYNATFRTWYQTTFHCATSNMCFAQSHESMAHTCVRFDRATTKAGTSPYFWPMANCQNVPSCIAVLSGDCTGVARLTALGRGIFLMIQEDTSGMPYYYGVLFARPRPRTAEEAAAAKRARALLLDMVHNLSSAKERDRLRSLIEAVPE